MDAYNEKEFDLKYYKILSEKDITETDEEGNKIIKKYIYIELDKKKISEEKKEKNKESMKKRMLETNKKRYMEDAEYREYVKQKRKEYYQIHKK